VGAPTVPRDWIDRAVGRDAEVATLWWGGPVLPFWELDFFNRSVGRAYSISGTYDTLPMTLVEPRPTEGLRRDEPGEAGAAALHLGGGDARRLGARFHRFQATARPSASVR
jgi:hypothetical protein